MALPCDDSPRVLRRPGNQHQDDERRGVVSAGLHTDTSHQPCDAPPRLQARCEIRRDDIRFALRRVHVDAINTGSWKRGARSRQ
jgi:hypothetical protein